jgi:hypothetical protein
MHAILFSRCGGSLDLSDRRSLFVSRETRDELTPVELAPFAIGEGFTCVTIAGRGPAKAGHYRNTALSRCCSVGPPSDLGVGSVRLQPDPCLSALLYR